MKESLTESPRLLRGDGWNFTEDGLGASHRPEKARLRRVHPLSWRTVVAVLDIDSPLIARFDEEDEEGLLEVVQVIEEMLLQSGNCLL